MLEMELNKLNILRTHHENQLVNLKNLLKQPLAPGQIVEGNILKLYPNNMAQIRLSTSQTLFAQLEASLNIGARYFFQVQENDQVLHLKVVGDTLSNQTKQNAENLLKHFGYKITKANSELVQSLMVERLTFDKSQLYKGIQFYNAAEHKHEALQAIKQIIAQQLPMTDSIFKAFYHKNSNQLSPLIKELFQLLQQEPYSTSIQQNLQKIFGRILESDGIRSIPMPVKESVRPFNDMSLSQSIHYVQQLIKESEDFPRIKEEINRRIIPSFPKEWRQHISKHIQTNVNKPHKLLLFLQTLMEEVKSSRSDAPNNHLRSVSLQVIKEQFTTFIYDYMQFIGSTDENRIKDGQHQTTLSLKAFLLQIIQKEADNGLGQRAQTLVHVLNGIQLQSINDTQHFIQASLQLPGEKFSLKEDILIDFESKKTEDGKVDPDHARVLFYLNLGNLKETVIDMQIQKRHVTIALYNDHKSIKKKAMALQPLLETRLQSLNYRLMSVSVKPLEQTEESHYQVPRTQPLYKQEGIDFRI